jgi:hypothetical protein
MSHKTGTPAQAKALVAIINAGRRTDGRPTLTTPEEGAVMRDVLALTQEEVRAYFDKVNARNGWNRIDSPASSAQIKKLWQLEKAVYGKPSTTFSSQLRWAEADERIKALAALLAYHRAEVKTLTSALSTFTASDLEQVSA